MTFLARLEEVQTRIQQAAARSGRSDDAVTLVAVSKRQPYELTEAAYAAGLRHFGENRVEEYEEKRGDLALPDATWHMIGHVQSRKTNDVLELGFRWVHSVDRFKIARRLSDGLPEGRDPLNILLEVNLSGDEAKYGFDLAAWPDAPAGALHDAVDAVLDLPGVRLRGLMTLAPYTEEPETVRPLFRRMRHLRDDLAARYPHADWSHLSMGMSADFEVAIEEGATMVRLGTILFGPRTY